MDHLSYRPLPFDMRENVGGLRRLTGEGFVDEAVVSAIIARGAYGRVRDPYGSLVLCASEDDYAGWHLATTPAMATMAPPDFYVA